MQPEMFPVSGKSCLVFSLDLARALSIETMVNKMGTFSAVCSRETGMSNVISCLIFNHRYLSLFFTMTLDLIFSGTENFQSYL